MKYLLLLAGLFLTSCSHTVLISEKEDAWIDDRSALWFAGGQFYYCRANKDNKGMAAPICYKAKFIEPPSSN